MFDVVEVIVEDENGVEAPLWKTLGLANEDDVIGMSKWLANRDLSATRYKTLMQQINAVEVLGYSSYDLIPEKEEVKEDGETTETAEREPISE